MRTLPTQVQWAAAGALAGAALFYGLAVAVNYELLGTGDNDLIEAAHRFARRNPAATAALSAVTHLADTRTLWLLTAAAAGATAFVKRYGLALAWVLEMSALGLSVTWLKLAFARDRHHFPDPVVREESFSFPSGHSAGSMAFYGFLVYVLCVLSPRRRLRILFALGGAAVVVAVGLSRLVLGAHYGTDVLAGYGVGMTVLFTTIAVVEWVRRPATSPASPST